MLLSSYGASWIAERPNLRPKSVELYRYLLRRHIAPHFESKAVAEIKEAQVRRWRKTLLDSGVSAVTAAKTYRLLKAILNTAVDDGIIRRNPCRIKGAGQEKSPERPVLTVPEVFKLAEVIDPRYSALVLLGTFGSLRWGELAGLRRKDIDPAAATIRVERQLTEVPGGGYAYGPPKSDASQRTVSIPDLIVPRINDASRPLRIGRERSGRVHQSYRDAAEAQQLPPPNLAPRAHSGRTADDPFPRSAPHG